MLKLTGELHYYVPPYVCTFANIVTEQSMQILSGSNYLSVQKFGVNAKYMKERANLIYTILFRNGKYHRHIVTAENMF